MELLIKKKMCIYIDLQGGQERPKKSRNLVNLKRNYLENIDIDRIIDIWLLISVKFPFEWYAWKTYFGNFTFSMT